MKKKNTHMILAAGTIGLFTTGVSSQAAGVFTGAGDGTSWEDTANWDDNIVPDSAAPITFNLLGTQTVEFDADAWSFLSANGQLNGGGTTGQYRGISRFFLGENTSGSTNGTQTFTFNHGGTNTVNVTSGNSGGIATRPNKTSILNVQSGIVDMGSGSFTIGGGGDGSLNVSGGEMKFGRAGVTVGSASGSTGSITVTGGTLTTRSSMALSATGSFSVVGSNASLIDLGGANTDGNGSWSQAAGSILSMMVDTSVTKIDISDGTNAGTPDATFAAGSILDLGFVGAFADGSWTLMEVENGIIDNGVSNNNLVLDAADIAAGWSYTVDNTGPNGLLIANFTAVPEPNVALLSLSALGLLARRRR